MSCLLLSFRRTTLSPTSSCGKSTRAETGSRKRVPFIGLMNMCPPIPPPALSCSSRLFPPQPPSYLVRADSSQFLMRPCLYAQCTMPNAVSASSYVPGPLTAEVAGGHNDAAPSGLEAAAAPSPHVCPPPHSASFTASRVPCKRFGRHQCNPCRRRCSPTAHPAQHPRVTRNDGYNRRVAQRVQCGSQAFRLAVALRPVSENEGGGVVH